MTILIIILITMLSIGISLLYYSVDEKKLTFIISFLIIEPTLIILFLGLYLELNK